MCGRLAERTFACDCELDRKESEVINRTTLAGLAAVTFVLLVASAAIGEGNDFLWIVDDVVWLGFLLCALALVVLTVGVLVRSLVRSRRVRS
jgi:hypothetical protein